MTDFVGFPDVDALWDFDRPEETASRLQEQLTKVKSNPSPDHTYHVELLTQLARVHGLQGKFAEAKQALVQADTLLNVEEGSCRAVAKIRHRLELGRIHILEKTPSQARSLLIEAWTLAGNAGEDLFSIDAAKMLAAIEPQKIQKDWILKALSIAEASPQIRANQCRGALYTTLGWMQFDLRQYEGALEFFKKALSCIKAEGIPRKTIIGKWAIAKTLRALGRLDEAFEIQKDLLAELSQLNAKDGFVYEELAECLRSLKRNSEAQVYFDLAYNELSKDEWLSDNKPERLKRLKELGKVKDFGRAKAP